MHDGSWRGTVRPGAQCVLEGRDGSCRGMVGPGGARWVRYGHGVSWKGTVCLDGYYVCWRGT